MAKKIKVVIAEGVKFGGTYPPIGTEIDMDEKEARRLLGLGAVSLPKPKIETIAEGPTALAGGAKKPTPAELEAELIEKINAAQNREELTALVADKEKRAAVVAAAMQRWKEIEAKEQLPSGE